MNEKNSKSKLLELFSKLDTNCPTTVRNVLSDIRTIWKIFLKNYKANNNEFERLCERLCEVGGVKTIVKFLGKSNQPVLNDAMSILADCCMSEKCRIEADASGIILLLIPILQGISNDEIQCRGCRLVGNLAQTHSIAKKLHEQKIVPCLVDILNSSTSPTTLVLGIRALRVLWNVDIYRREMVKAETVKAVAFHLNSGKSDVRQAVLKALRSFTERCSPACAQQVNGDGSGYQLLITNISDSRVPCCLYNLSNIPETRLNLIKAGAIDAIVARLKSCIEQSLVITLCLLCSEPVGRAHLRHSQGGLALLLNFLKDSKNQDQKIHSLRALFFFSYDDNTLQFLISQGLVSVLISKLKEFVHKHGTVHTAKPLSDDGVDSPGRVSTSSSGFSPVCYSPISTSSEAHSTSPSSSIFSPEMNSPLYISHSELDLSLRQINDELHLTSFEIGDKANTIMREELYIMQILNQVVYLDKPIPMSSLKSTFTTLVDYMNWIQNPLEKATKILRAVACNKVYYQQLMNDEFVLTLHRRLCRPTHSNCYHCDYIYKQGKLVLTDNSKLAESGYGEGDMICRLRKGDHPSKILTSVSIPYVIRERHLLRKLLEDYHGLDFLLEAFTDNTEDAVSSFNELFRTLKISNPQVPINICSQCDVGSLRKEGTVVFVLDDGSRVTANKTSLCNNSPMFQAMFSGSFSETDQTDVRLSDISASCLTHFLRIADNYCECILPKDIETLLELIIATDKFLVSHLTPRILSVVMNQALTYKTSHIIYRWALEKGYTLPYTANVPRDVVKFTLVSEMTPKQRLESVMLVLNSPHKNEFLIDLVNIVQQKLNFRKPHNEV